MVTFLGGGQDEARFSLRDYPVAQAALQRVPEQSWSLMAKTIFVLRHVFHEDCISEGGGQMMSSVWIAPDANATAAPHLPLTTR
jgi:hypothetical protein